MHGVVGGRRDGKREGGTWRGRSQVGNLCSAACGKVVARNLEIAEAERGRKKEKRGRYRVEKETRKREIEEKRREMKEREKEREACRSERKAEGEGRGSERGREEMARWSLSVGKRD